MDPKATGMAMVQNSLKLQDWLLAVSVEIWLAVAWVDSEAPKEVFDSSLGMVYVVVLLQNSFSSCGPDIFIPNNDCLELAKSTSPGNGERSNLPR